MQRFVSVQRSLGGMLRSQSTWASSFQSSCSENHIHTPFCQHRSQSTFAKLPVAPAGCSENHVHGPSCHGISSGKKGDHPVLWSGDARAFHSKVSPNSSEPSKTLPDLEGAKSGIYEVLLRNREWAKENKNLFRPLSEGQKPKYFVICCADSRCPTEKMMGFNPGECFTVRNIANCVVNGDLGINAATQFAIDVLGVENILVVGHRDCGGVKAAMTRQSFGTTIDMYVRHVRDVYRQHLPEIDKIEDPEKRLNTLIERHVIEQCINVFKMGFVQRARRKARAAGKPYMPQIHGLVYDPSTGLLDELDIGLRDKARDYGKVYDVLAN